MTPPLAEHFTSGVGGGRAARPTKPGGPICWPLEAIAYGFDLPCCCEPVRVSSGAIMAANELTIEALGVKITKIDLGAE